MNVISKLFFGSVLSGFVVVASASTGAPLKIVEVRPYMGSNDVVFAVSANSVCNTDHFRIRGINTMAGKAAYAAVLAALAAGNKVRVEVTNCQGWGSNIQSVYMTDDQGT